MHHASESSGFRSPIAAQLAHSRSEQDAIELQPSQRPKENTRTGKGTPERAKKRSKKSKNATQKTQKTQKTMKTFADPKNAFIRALVSSLPMSSIKDTYLFYFFSGTPTPNLKQIFVPSR
jgi:hypothetical protein